MAIRKISGRAYHWRMWRYPSRNMLEMLSKIPNGFFKEIVQRESGYQHITSYKARVWRVKSQRECK